MLYCIGMIIIFQKCPCWKVHFLPVEGIPFLVLKLIELREYCKIFKFCISSKHFLFYLGLHTVFILALLLKFILGKFLQAYKIRLYFHTVASYIFILNDISQFKKLIEKRSGHREMSKLISTPGWQVGNVMKVSFGFICSRQ